jgi:hypothetical protein
MRKIGFILLLICFTLSVDAQIKGVDFDKAKAVNNDSDMEYETLFYLRGKEYSYYLFNFEQTPVGLKHCITKTKELVNLNNLDFNNPDHKDDLFADYVDGITDYQSLFTSIKVGSSEINRLWILPNEYKIGLRLAKDYFTIGLHPPNE